MVRGTFANVRLRNKWSRPRADSLAIFRPTPKCRSSTRRKNIAKRAPRSSFLPAKNTAPARRATGRRKVQRLLGVRAVIAESYERIHRSNLVGMGILPLQFPAGQNAESLKLTGEEVFEISGIRDLVDHFAAGREVKVRATSKGQPDIEFNAVVRIDTPQEALYYANGGILQYVLRQLLATKKEPVGV